MTHPTEDERKAFEAHFIAKDIPASAFVKRRHDHPDEYDEEPIQCLWEGWQAQSERIKVLEDALKWYADENNWDRDGVAFFQDGDTCDDYKSDKGLLAREALNQGKVTR
jgi:hypothetical protein